MIKEDMKKERLFGGVDLHKSRSVIYVENEKGEKVASKSINTRKEEFEEFFCPFLKRYDIEVAVEAGNLSFWLCDALHTWRIQTYVVNTLLNKAISESCKKTDKRDARTLCLQLRKGMLPEKIYEPGQNERELRAMVQLRHQLKKDRVRVINRAHAWLIRNGVFVSKRDLHNYEGNWRLILNEKIKHHSEAFILGFQFYLESFLLLSRQIKDIEEKIRSRVMEESRQEYEYLTTIPGVGEVTAWAVLAFAGDAKRFKNVRKFTSYMGLVPRVRESGGKKASSGRVTKMGVSILRGYLTQGATSISRNKEVEANKPLVEFFESIRKRKGWRKAKIALSRKIAAVIFGVLKNRIPYDPHFLIRKAA